MKIIVLLLLLSGLSASAIETLDKKQQTIQALKQMQAGQKETERRKYLFRALKKAGINPDPGFWYHQGGEIKEGYLIVHGKKFYGTNREDLFYKDEKPYGKNIQIYSTEDLVNVLSVDQQPVPAKKEVVKEVVKAPKPIEEVTNKAIQEVSKPVIAKAQELDKKIEAAVPKVKKTQGLIKELLSWYQEVF